MIENLSSTEAPIPFTWPQTAFLEVVTDYTFF